MDGGTGVFGYCDPQESWGAHNPKQADDVLFGYGFGYVYTRDVALQMPYMDMNQGEDLKFYNGIRDRNVGLRHEVLNDSKSEVRSGEAEEADDNLNMSTESDTDKPDRLFELLDPCGIALFNDTEGICLHIVHKHSTSGTMGLRLVAGEERKPLDELVKSYASASCQGLGMESKTPTVDPAVLNKMLDEMSSSKGSPTLLKFPLMDGDE
eukprot:gnl/TRDRNA2_/TRDRNA2_33346_c0_seq1.p1 gnl/TRDRNA2_/TRDRNA2_33346_c0~~gnl/TRDRNA2_/TRDRNA2_33346_c0_seq1.p1  ORF type:complete len:236 (+),score=34.65 gnl/TRDRNA2_/TRDRNA2_33346_c0_seq1:82-708(+)